MVDYNGDLLMLQWPADRGPLPTVYPLRDWPREGHSGQWRGDPPHHSHLCQAVKVQVCRFLTCFLTLSHVWYELGIYFNVSIVFLLSCWLIVVHIIIYWTVDDFNDYITEFESWISLGRLFMGILLRLTDFNNICNLFINTTYRYFEERENVFASNYISFKFISINSVFWQKSK